MKSVRDRRSQTVDETNEPEGATLGSYRHRFLRFRKEENRAAVEVGRLQLEPRLEMKPGP